jgi:hypothetical protein
VTGYREHGNKNTGFIKWGEFCEKLSSSQEGICSSLGRYLTYLLTYLLTQRNRVLLEKLIGSQLVKKLPEFYGTRRFITAYTRALHLSPL